MSKISLVCLILVVSMIAYINAHGRMMEPPNRGSVWRLPEGINFPKAQFDTEWCGFENPDDKKNKRNATCGVCGPIYNNDPSAITEIYKGGPGIFANVTSFERTSPIYKGDIVRTYKKGQWVTTNLRIAANHGGVVQFRFCKADKLSDDPKMNCFDKHRLRFENGKFWYPLNNATMIDAPVYNREGKVVRTEKQHSFRVKLPNWLVCEHCLFQWRWFKTKNTQLYYGNACILNRKFSRKSFIQYQIINELNPLTHLLKEYSK